MSVANFIPTLWCARLLEHLDRAHVYAALCNRDYEGEIRNFGDTVKINQIGDITIKDYSKGEIEAPDDLDGTQQILTIDQMKYFNFAIEDVDNAQTNPKLMNDAMSRSAYAMNDVTDTFLANLMAVNAGNTLGSDASAIVPTKNDAYDYLVDLGTALTEANVPLMGRWVVVPAWYHALLLKDDRFVSSGTDFNKNILQGGEVGTAAGFSIHLSNNVPNTDGAKYKIVAGTNIASSFAEQLIQVEAFRPERAFSDAMKGLHVYGAKVVQPTALVCMTANKA